MKKKTFFTIALFIFFIFGSTSIIYSDNNFFFNLKKKIPTSIKDPIKKIFYFSIVSRENKNLKNEISDNNKKINKLNEKIAALESEIFTGKKSSEEIIKLNDLNFNLKKIFIPYANFVNGKNIKSGYLSIYKDNVIATLWSGKIISIKIDNLTKEISKINNVQSNLSGFLKQKDRFISVKDTLIINQTLYVSYTKVIDVDNCLNISILKADLTNINFFNFEEFFTYNDCLKGRFGGYQAGGRLEEFKDNKIILSTGDFQNFGPSQELDNNFGKIISIDLINKESKILSMGHRNPQGLFYLKDIDTLISTEHGQRGGDEINKILINETKVPNYGWPISSYSDYYGYEDYEIRKKAPFHKSHSKYGFEEPIGYFTPSWGISQVIDAKNFKKSFNDKTLMVTSLKNKNIYFLEFNKNFTKIINQKEINIGERIRDIIKLENDKYLLFLEDTPAIAILSIS